MFNQFNFYTMDKKEFTKEQQNEIVRLYINEWKTVKDIAKNFSCGTNRIKQCLIDNNIEITRNRQKINPKVIDEAIKLLDEGKSLGEVSKITGYNRNTLSIRVRERGYKIINHQNEAKFNESVFDIIDTEEKAYWLGFIFADGYISSPLAKGKHKGKNNYSFELCLQIKDTEHLVKFNSFMNHNKNNILIDTKDPIRPRCRWSVKNKHLWEALNKLGCTPKKSLTLVFPDKRIFKDESLIIPFIRGFFDGDGTFSYNGSGWVDNVYPHTGFTGTKPMLEEIIKILNLNARWYKDFSYDNIWNGITWQCSFNTSESLKLINILYDNATIYLDRKYKLYKFFKNGSRSLKEFNELQEGKIGELCDENTEVSSEIAKGSETP